VETHPSNELHKSSFSKEGQKSIQDHTPDNDASLAFGLLPGLKRGAASTSTSVFTKCFSGSGIGEPTDRLSAKLMKTINDGQKPIESQFRRGIKGGPQLFR